ncbi:hypothetical protein AB0I22_32645 [Streptomyces sp. NPDC050610]|uniref:hypothetical protein n=1 Tax=Streptomyces sp. NPDC050610 TaxID=3157097 RepID=UPI00344614F4
MIEIAVSFLLGSGAGALLFRWRALRDDPRSEAARQSVTAFGEELAALDFDPSGQHATPAVLEEYRAALAAYERASAGQTVSGMLAALHDGRVAMIRFAALRDGRPVPIEAVPLQVPASRPRPQPVTAPGERHVSSGRTNGPTEVLIDRPEPAQPAILELDVLGYEHLHVAPVVRTEQETTIGYRLAETSFQREYHGRHYLPPHLTHLRVTAQGVGKRHWIARIRPLFDATPLAAEHQGQNAEVLRYDGGPALFTVQTRGQSTWTITYKCGCLRHWIDCDCPNVDWPDGIPGRTLDTQFCGGGELITLRLPRAGYIALDCSDGSPTGSWYLTTKPVDVPEPPPARHGEDSLQRDLGVARWMGKVISFLGGKDGPAKTMGDR